MPVRDGEERKIVLVVSRDALNDAGINVILARLTSRERYRGLPTAIEVQPTHDNGLSQTSFVLCHDVFSLPQAVLDPRRKGQLELWPLRLVGDALRYALAVD